MTVVLNPKVYSLNDSQSTYDFGTSSSGSSNISVTSGTGINVPWVSTTSDHITFDPNWNNSTSAKIRLDGPNADIEINGESLIDMLRNIEQRLNILKPNPELESEWAELRALGDQYRRLEDKIQAKMKTWDAISK